MENTRITISVVNPIAMERDSYTVMLPPPVLFRIGETDHQLIFDAYYIIPLTVITKNIDKVFFTPTNPQLSL